MIEKELSRILSEHGFALAGWTPLKNPKNLDHYKEWLSKDFAGEMDYLRSHLPTKESPASLLSGARSAIVIGKNYLPHPTPWPEDFPLKNVKIALYAKGEDYHHWLKKELSSLQASLENHYPEERFLPFVDSSPVLERDLAYRAGLGWRGKNTCLINQKEGSLFVIGGLLSTLSVKPRLLAPDRCGTCTRCIDTCPTGAFTRAGELDARKCISYLTIESKSEPDEELRTAMNDWLFGCDICQTVCPWNQKVWQENDLSPTVDREQTLLELRWILTSSNSQLQKKLKGTPLTRAGKKLKRSAIIVATNEQFKELLPDIMALKENSYFTNLCSWAERMLNKSL